MTVWQRITRLALMGVMVGSLTACNLVGWWAIGGSNPDLSGYASSTESALTAFLIGGNYVSQAGSVKVVNGEVRKVQTRRIVHAPDYGCFWAEISCSGIGAASPEGRVGITTVDTNGDGYISGAADFQAPYGGNCGMTDGATASTGAGMPASAIWLDTPTCKTPNLPGTFTSALTEASINQAWGGTVGMQFPNDPVSGFRVLPFETVQEIMNSLDSSDVTTEMVGSSPMTVANLQVTNLKIGGDSYRPVNVFIKLYNWGATKWDMSKEPGLKLMAAWAANKIETLLTRGATSIRMELELNGGVTLTRDSLPANLVVTEPSFSTVESWRNFATSGLRD